MPGTRFSIVITSYNQRDFIRAAADSALSQRHPLKEIIVVDDGSSDGSQEILEQYADSIQLVRFPSNRGAIEARNHGAARAKGEYLVFLDGDDLFMPWALDVYERIIAERHPTTIVSGARWFEGPVPVVRRDDVPKRLEFIEYESLMAGDRQHGWLTGAFVVCRRAFHDAGGWSPGIFHLDLMDLAAKLGYSGKSILICSPRTILYRMHATNSTRFVPPFLRSAHRIMNTERAGQYPGGQWKRFERYAFQGGMIVFWTKRALRAGLYKEALRLAASGRSMILAAVVRRTIARIMGRRPLETLEFRRG